MNEHYTNIFFYHSASRREILKLHLLLFCLVLLRFHLTESYRVRVSTFLKTLHASPFARMVFDMYNFKCSSVIVILRFRLWLSSFVRTHFNGSHTYDMRLQFYKWKMAIWHKANTPKVSIVVVFFYQQSKDQYVCHIFWIVFDKKYLFISGCVAFIYYSKRTDVIYWNRNHAYKTITLCFPQSLHYSCKVWDSLQM